MGDIAADWKPNKWLAVFLTVFVWPFGLLYLGSWSLPLVYLGLLIAAIIVEWSLSGTMILAPAMFFGSALYAWWFAKNARPRQRPWYIRWYAMIGLYVATVAVIVLIRSFLIEPYRVPSTSMEPTIPERSFLLARKVGYGNFGTFGFALARVPPMTPPKRGDMVVYESPVDEGKRFVKRVLAIPGDTIEFRNKAVTVNGVALAVTQVGEVVTERLDGVEYDTLLSPRMPARDFEFTVPEGHYFCVGDNRDFSDDSRRQGAVPGHLLVGEVLYVIKRGHLD